MQPPRNLRRRAQPPRSPVIPPPAFTAPSRPQSHPRARSSWSTPQSMPPSTASHRARSPLPAPAVPAPPRSPRHRAQLPIPSRSPRRLPVPAVPAPCNASAPGMEYLRRQWNCGTGWSSEHQISTLRHQISVAPPSMEGLWPRARNGAASIHALVRNHSLMLLLGVGTDVIRFDLSPRRRTRARTRRRSQSPRQLTVAALACGRRCQPTPRGRGGRGSGTSCPWQPRRQGGRC
ncbi:hypothetical protein ZEAMMB73_Zm00001d031051 [Zea mays]|uniref:Uncharacterized protein n=1 Tax=Zea mays TaxID=4577 RepID=A0A1D6KG46_MAIZE|nr:hypothetical protein ZEAMMB73_Zm00001d031051 [Zea mays]